MPVGQHSATQAARVMKTACFVCPLRRFASQRYSVSAVSSLAIYYYIDAQVTNHCNVFVLTGSVHLHISRFLSGQGKKRTAFNGIL